MPQQIEVEGVGTFEFPDSATESDISSTLTRELGSPPPNRGVLGEVGARMGRGALQVLKGISDYGAAAQRFYGPLAKLSPIGYGDFERSSQAVESAMPQPGVRQGFGYDVAEGLGQFAPMLLAGLGAGALAGGGAVGGAAAMGTAASLGFGMEFSDAYDRELERQQREGLESNPDLAFAKAMGYGTVSSLIEGKFGSGRIARKIGEALAGDGGRMLLSRGVSPELVRRVAINAGREAGVGFGQEAAQRFAQDIIVEGRPEWEGIGYEGLVGGAVQGLTGIPLGAVQVRAADQNARLKAALEQNKILEQEANERRNQLAFAQANDARMGVQPNAYVPTDTEILGGPSPTSVAAARLAALESRPPETFGPGFRGDIVPRIELTPDVRERLAALRKQDQEAASRGVAVEQAASNLGALEGQPERFSAGTRAMPYAVPQLSPEITEQLWRIRQQEAANASAVRTSPGQLPQEGPVAQGVQTPSGNVVERQPQAEEPVVKGAQAPKPPKVRNLRSQPQPKGGGLSGEMQGQRKEKVVAQPSAAPVNPEPAFQGAVQKQTKPQRYEPELNVGEKIEFLYDGKWYPATITESASIWGKRAIENTPWIVPPEHGTYHSNERGVDVNFKPDVPGNWTLLAHQKIRRPSQTPTGVQQKPAWSITQMSAAGTASPLPKFSPQQLAALGVSVGEGAPLAAWEKKSLAGLGYEPWTVDALDVGEARRIIRDKEEWKRVKPLPKQEVAEPSKQKTEALPGAAVSIVDALDQLSAYGLRKKAESITLVRDKEGKVVDSYVETERIPAEVAAVEKDELTGKREEEALVKLANEIGVPGNVSAASVFARRFWENVDANANPVQKAKIADAMLRGEPTPIAADVAAKQAAGLQASVADAQNRFADFQNATPWFTVGASPAIGGGQARTLRIGDATRDILGRLGAAVVEDATLDRALAARADATGNIQLAVNADRLGRIDPSAHNAVGTEELIHVAHFRVLHREWVKNGKRGTFAGYVEKEMGTLRRGLDQKIRDQVVAEYSGGQQVQMQDGEWGFEYLRRIIQKARYGNLTEDFVVGAKPKVESIFRRVLNFLREVILGSPYSTREFELIAAVEAVLDGLAINVAMSPRSQAVIGGEVAGRGVTAGVSPALESGEIATGKPATIEFFHGFPSRTPIQDELKSSDTYVYGALDKGTAQTYTVGDIWGRMASLYGKLIQDGEAVIASKLMDPQDRLHESVLAGRETWTEIGTGKKTYHPVDPKAVVIWNKLQNDPELRRRAERILDLRNAVNNISSRARDDFGGIADWMTSGSVGKYSTSVKNPLVVDFENHYWGTFKWKFSRNESGTYIGSYPISISQYGKGFGSWQTSPRGMQTDEIRKRWENEILKPAFDAGYDAIIIKNIKDEGVHRDERVTGDIIVLKKDHPVTNISERGGTGQSFVAGVSPAIRSIEHLKEIVSKGGSEQVPELLERRLQAEQSLFSDEWVKQLKTRYDQATLPKDSYTVPPTGWTLRRENMVARMLKPIVDKVRIVAGMRDPASLPEDERGAAYYYIANTHQWLMGKRGVIGFKLEQEKDIQEELKEMQVGIDAAKAIGSTKTVAANDLAKGYRQYLLNVQKALPPASTLQGRIAGLLSKAALAVKQDGTQKQEGWNGVFESGNVENAIQWIADQPAITIDGTTTPEQVVDQAVAIGANGDMGIAGSVDSSNEKRDALYRGVKDDTGKYVVAPALHNIPNLPEIINLIRGLQSDLKQTIKETEAFKQLLGLKLDKKGGSPVALRKFISEYMRLRAEAADNVNQARAFSKRFQRNENRILAFADVLGLLDGLMGTPEYFNKVVEALKATNMYEDVIHYPRGKTGNKLVYDPIEKKDVEISVGLTKEGVEGEDQNIERIQKVVENIDKYIESVGEKAQVSDPLKFISYKRASDQLKAMWIDPMLAPEWNIVNPRLFGALWPKFTPGLNKRYMAEFIGGRMGRALNTAITHLDVLLGKIYNIGQDPNIGTNAVQLALRGAMESHGMNPDDAKTNDVYEREVLNWIVYNGQYASQVMVKAGEPLDSGRKATPQDIAAAKKVVAYRNAIRRVSEKDSIVNSLHSSIAEELGVERTVGGKVIGGQTSIHRNTITEGPLETAASKRVRDQGVRDFVLTFVSADYDTKLKMLDPVNNWQWFHDVIIGHLGATDPLFNRTRTEKSDKGNAAWRRGSIYEDKIRKLHEKVRRGEVQLTDWEHVSEALGEQDVATVQKNLINEVSGWLEKYKKEEIDTAKGEDESTPMKKIIASLHNDGSFMHPRLKANAPPTFYRYGDSTGPDLAGYAANAANIARARVLEEMERMTNALGLYVESFSGGSEREMELESRKQVETGKKRFSYSEAKRIHKQMQKLTEWFGQYAKTHAAAFDHGINQFIRATNSFYAGTLLQSPMAVLNNAIDALYSNPLLMNTYISNWQRVLLSPLYTTQQIFNVAMGRIMAATKKYPELKKWVKKNNTFLSRTLKAMIEDWELWNKLKSQLDAGGINTGYDWQNQRALRRQAWGNTFFSLDAYKRAVANRDPGAILPGLGTLEREGQKSSFLLKFGRTIYNSWLPAYLMRYVPRRVDQLANVMIAMQWTKAMAKLMAKSIEISENRSVEDGNGNGVKIEEWHLNPKNHIKPEELEMTAAQMNILRKSLDPIGGLERVMFGYYKRLQDAKEKGEDPSTVPWMEDGEMDNWLMAVMQAGNVVREGNTIDVARAYGTPGTLFFTFLSWPANRLLNVAKSFNKMNYEKGGMPTVAALAALLITAIAAKELKRPIVEAVTGKVSSMPTLGNVANEGNPVEWARYLTSALGSMIPLIGNTVEIVTGGATGRPLFDATASIPALGLVADTFDTAKRAVQSGDQRVWLDWINRHTPLYALAVNRLPGVEADLAARNAARAVRAATPADMEVRAMYGRGGGMARVTPFTRHLRSAEAAAYSGNESEFRASVDAAKQYQMAKGQDEKSAEQAVVSYLRSRMPMSRVYGRAVSPAEYERVTGRMSAAQRRAFEPSTRAYRMAERVTGRKLRAFREPRRKTGSRSTLRIARLPKIRTKLPSARRMRSARPIALA